MDSEQKSSGQWAVSRGQKSRENAQPVAGEFFGFAQDRVRERAGAGGPWWGGSGLLANHLLVDHGTIVRLKG